jgi:hypothetical protein
MIDLLVAMDLVRTQTQQSLAPKVPRVDPRKAVRPERAGLRSLSAAALRGLADRLEPSPTA